MQKVTRISLGWALSLLGILTLPFSSELVGEVTLPPVFGDHMVLQQGMTLPVWGKANPGEKVSVLLGERHASTVADARGRWRVMLPPLPTSAQGLSLVVNGENRLEVRDVVVGEVWIAGGGENMSVSLQDAPMGHSLGKAEPDLRFFVPGESEMPGHWLPSLPGNEGKIPAIGYAFARDVSSVRHLPVGILLLSSRAPLAQWIPPSEGHRLEGGKFRRCVSPILPYAMSGILWYPSEADEGANAPGYRAGLLRLIRSWRNLWGEGPFPFYSVLPAGFGDPDAPVVEPFRTKEGKTGRALPWLRESVAASLSLPMTGVASATDLGTPDDHLPSDKLDLGRRLALLARTGAYGEERVASGPLFRSLVKDGHTLRVSFASTGRGLVLGHSPWRSRAWSPEVVSHLRGFAISGDDGAWYPAEGRIEGDAVILSSDAVPLPQAARYDWKGFPIGNLYNREGLPALPFRSDSRQPE